MIGEAMIGEEQMTLVNELTSASQQHSQQLLSL